MVVGGGGMRANAYLGACQFAGAGPCQLKGSTVIVNDKLNPSLGLVELICQGIVWMIISPITKAEAN